jgi:hypothetical protein
MRARGQAIETLYDGRGTSIYALPPVTDRTMNGYHSDMVDAGKKADKARALKIIDNGDDFASLTLAYSEGRRRAVYGE